MMPAPFGAVIRIVPATVPMPPESMCCVADMIILSVRCRGSCGAVLPSFLDDSSKSIVAAPSCDCRSSNSIVEVGAGMVEEELAEEKDDNLSRPIFRTTISVLRTLVFRIFDRGTPPYYAVIKAALLSWAVPSHSSGSGVSYIRAGGAWLGWLYIAREECHSGGVFCLVGSMCSDDG